MIFLHIFLHISAKKFKIAYSPYVCSSLDIFACDWIFLHISWDPFLLALFLAIQVPFQEALQQQIRVNSALPVNILYDRTRGAPAAAAAVRQLPPARPASWSLLQTAAGLLPPDWPPARSRAGRPATAAAVAVRGCRCRRRLPAAGRWPLAAIAAAVHIWWPAPEDAVVLGSRPALEDAAICCRSGVDETGSEGVADNGDCMKMRRMQFQSGNSE